MTTFSAQTHPRLRREVDAQPIEYARRPYLLVRDHLELTSQSLLVPQQLAPLLALCDGTRRLGELQAALMVRYGVQVSADEITQFIEAFDEALLLDNVRSKEAARIALKNYRDAPFRPMSCAPHIYPPEPEALQTLLDGYLDGLGTSETRPAAKTFRGRGLISPHIDYTRGGPVYAQVWREAEIAAQEAELVVIFGTDHYGGEDRITLTRQDYATPYGSLPTDQKAVDLLAAAIGEESAFAGELRHRSEHSIELAAVWLHHMRAGRPVKVLPILCGSFESYIMGILDPDQDPFQEKFFQVLQQAVRSHRVLFVAAADLAHVGPVFGGSALDILSRERLRNADERLITQITAGSAAGFLQEIRAVEDRNNICGTAPIYLTLRALETTSGKVSSYAICPADPAQTSSVTICGMLLE